VKPILFQCPTTGYKVQGLVPKDTDEGRDDVFVSVNCAACSSAHLVNPKSGQTLNPLKR